jgi:hypothetical protein
MVNPRAGLSFFEGPAPDFRRETGILQGEAGTLNSKAARLLHGRLSTIKLVSRLEFGRVGQGQQSDPAVGTEVDPVPRPLRRLLRPQGYSRPSGRLRPRPTFRRARKKRRADRLEGRCGTIAPCRSSSVSSSGTRTVCGTGSRGSSPPRTKVPTPAVCLTKPATSRRGTRRPGGCRGVGPAGGPVDEQSQADVRG